MICEKDKCTGCFACVNICPKKCITMKEDKLGNIYPEIDLEKCVKCGACNRVCPQINKVKLEKPQKAYAMYNKDSQLRKESTSGGAATTFYTHILNKNGIVYGTNNLENGEINFIRITSVDELYKLKGSKYVHSHINNTFQLVKKDLSDSKLVLFIGTPCQIAGLKKYLKKEYENLFLIDIICHGVPSQKLLREEIESHNLDNVKKITFRGDDGYKFKLYNETRNILSEELYENAYYQGFFNAIFFRPNCYKCIYATPERASDITIGDFWGLGPDSELYDKDNKGVSVLLPITQKGMKLIEECKEDMIIEERNIKEAVNGNTQLRRPSIKSKKYDKFKKIYLKYGYKKACKTFMRGNKFKAQLKIKLKNNKTIYMIYKKIRGKINYE